MFLVSRLISIYLSGIMVFYIWGIKFDEVWYKQKRELETSHLCW